MIRMIPTRLMRSFPSCNAPFRAASSLSLLKDLRARTGAPIVECQKAIAACPDAKEDDLTPILDWLRLHSSAKVTAKVAGRTTDEGLVGYYGTPTSAVLVKVAAETDFAAHSEQFRQFLRTVLPTVCHAPPEIAIDDDTDALMQLPISEGRTLQDALQEAQLAIRENLGISQVRRWFQPDNSYSYHAYVHNRVDQTDSDESGIMIGTAAAGVVLQGAPEQTEAIGKHLAMHIVAAKPLYLSVEAIPDDMRAKELDLVTQQCQENSAKKPPAIVEKMIQGRMQKWYDSVCLLEQAHMIQEGNPKIRTFLEQQNVTLQEYHYLSI